MNDPEPGSLGKIAGTIPGHSISKKGDWLRPAFFLLLAWAILLGWQASEHIAEVRRHREGLERAGQASLGMLEAAIRSMGRGRRQRPEFLEMVFQEVSSVPGIRGTWLTEPNGNVIYAKRGDLPIQDPRSFPGSLWQKDGVLIGRRVDIGECPFDGQGRERSSQSMSLPTYLFLSLDPAEVDREIASDLRLRAVIGGAAGLAAAGAFLVWRARGRTRRLRTMLAIAEVRDAVEAIRNGAADYLEKPVDLEELEAVIAETIGGIEGSEAGEPPPLPEHFVVASAPMMKAVGEAALVAATDTTVLITGESGTGKERVAEFIHLRSRRRDAPFIRVNCAAIPATLVESELFGHKRGSFTGAEANRVGRFEAAAGGTILLDEVGELPVEVQPKLLRVLEDGSFERVGESESRRSDARVIAATNRDLEREVPAQRFREDLFWRLNVFRVHLPPLRERREEIPILARSFLSRSGGEKVRLSPAALRILEDYRWPGNVRELANVLERASILAAGGVILPEHLPEALRRPGDGHSLLAGGGTRVSEAAGAAGTSEPGAATVEEAERRAIRDALQKTGGNRTRAAKLLGISRRTLLYRLKAYGGQP